MTQITHTTLIVSPQGKAADRERRSSTRAMFKALLIAEAILVALIFAHYVAQKTIATVQMAPHCQAIEPCSWQPGAPDRLAAN